MIIQGFYTKKEANKQLTSVAKVCMFLRIIGAYLNGSSWKVYFKAWNPLAYITLLIIFLCHFVLYGISGFEECSEGISLRFKKHKYDYSNLKE